MSFASTSGHFGYASRPQLPVFGQSRQPHGNVRRRGRERYQARVYVGGRKGGAVHLGMYESETAAEQVARKVLKALLGTGCRAAKLGPLDVWRAARRLAGEGWDVGDQLGSLLPRWVCPDGRGGYGYRIHGGNGCNRGGFRTVEDAYEEAVRARKRMRPGGMVQQLLFGDAGEHVVSDVRGVRFVPSVKRRVVSNASQRSFEGMLSDGPDSSFGGLSGAERENAA